MPDSITPPPELVEKWVYEWNTRGVRHPDATSTASYVAIRAAQWGANQELEACCEWLAAAWKSYAAVELRAARRPKPPSLKAQAMEALERQCLRSISPLVSTSDLDTIRRALEALDD